MSKEYKFNRNYLKLLIDNKDKLIEVPINDVKLILTYCEILLDRQDKARECINYYAIEDDDFNKLYNVEEQELLAILGDKENE